MKQLLILLFVFAGLCAFPQSREQFKEEQELRASISRFNTELMKVRSEINNRPTSKAELIATRDSLQRRADDGLGLTLEMKEAFLRRIKILDAQIENYHSNNEPWAYKSLLLKEKFLLDTIRDMNNMLNMFQKKSIGEAMNDKIPVAMNSCRAKKYKNSHAVRKSEAQTDIAELQVIKLSGQRVIADSKNGYYGKIVNHTRRNYVTFVIKDSLGVMPPKLYKLAPGQTEIDYLLPGTYYAEAFISGESIWKEKKVFHVGVQLHHYLGEELHFAVFQDDDYRLPNRYLN